jgi:hypothetical protein
VLCFYLTLLSIIDDRIMVQPLEAFDLFINDVITSFKSHSNFSSCEIEVKMIRCLAFFSSSSFECIVNKR